MRKVTHIRSQYKGDHMSENIRRGYVPSDERDFSDEMLPKLQRALSDIHEFLDKGYE